MSAAERRFITEISSLIDKTVSVITVDGKTYIGTLAGINPANLSLCLSDARDDKGQVIPKIVLSGGRVAEILSVKKPFDLKGLAERLERVFPRMVKLYDKEGFIWVMDKIKEKGLNVIIPFNYFNRSYSFPFSPNTWKQKGFF
ncbi:MAG: hypothetical protein N3E47_02060, partial [Candidatus Bathyarchaeota archaeon]|nr:hypothetical protein [Candidatus Bathyarchaeota archaeon]